MKFTLSLWNRKDFILKRGKIYFIRYRVIISAHSYECLFKKIEILLFYILQILLI